MPTWKKYATTDLATAAAPGLCPTLSNVVTEFLNGQGAFSTPAGAGGVKVKAETRDMTAASGDVSYTGYGFTPTGLIIFSYMSGTGGSIGSSNPAKALILFEIQSATAFAFYAVFIIYLRVLSTIQSAIVKSYDADGFTLTWTKTSTPTGTGYLTVFAFK